MKRNYSRVIEELRTIHGLNLVAIVQRIGTDPRTVGKWQAGKHKPNKDSRKKINALYREVRKDMTTQNAVNPFEDFFNLSKGVSKRPTTEVIATQQFGSKSFKVYGDKDNPLFVAVEVAEMIEVQNTTDLLKRVDEDEKLTYVVSRAGQRREVNMLTEFGLYEVLFQSRKPKAKEFKKVVKQILKEIRQQGYYMAGELIDEPETPQALPTLEQAENNYIDTLAKAIQESSSRAEKMELIERLNNFVSGL